MNLNSIANAAEGYLQRGFTADVHPGCANFVSHCLKAAGSSLGIINYVPNIVSKCQKVGKAFPGDLLVFKNTYDADGDGITEGDPDDDMTHIGVYAGNNVFYDYGGSPAGVRKQKLEGWWLEHFQFSMRPKELKTIKLFTNEKGKTMIVNGKSEAVSVMGMYAANKNKWFTVEANRLNNEPYLSSVIGDGKVVSMEVVIKFEEM